MKTENNDEWYFDPLLGIKKSEIYQEEAVEEIEIDNEEQQIIDYFINNLNVPKQLSERYVKEHLDKLKSYQQCDLSLSGAFKYFLKNEQEKAESTFESFDQLDLDNLFKESKFKKNINKQITKFGEAYFNEKLSTTDVIAFNYLIEDHTIKPKSKPITFKILSI